MWMPKMCRWGEARCRSSRFCGSCCARRTAGSCNWSTKQNQKTRSRGWPNPWASCEVRCKTWELCRAGRYLCEPQLWLAPRHVPIFVIQRFGHVGSVKSEHGIAIQDALRIVRIVCASALKPTDSVAVGQAGSASPGQGAVSDAAAGNAVACLRFVNHTRVCMSPIPKRGRLCSGKCRCHLRPQGRLAGPVFQQSIVVGEHQYLLSRVGAIAQKLGLNIVLAIAQCPIHEQTVGIRKISAIESHDDPL